MYFESTTKKMYYRFPSVNSIHDLDSRYYFPEKSGTSEEDTRLEAQLTNYHPDRESYYDI